MSLTWQSQALKVSEHAVPSCMFWFLLTLCLSSKTPVQEAPHLQQVVTFPPPLLCLLWTLEAPGRVQPLQWPWLLPLYLSGGAPVCAEFMVPNKHWAQDALSLSVVGHPDVQSWASYCWLWTAPSALHDHVIHFEKCTDYCITIQISGDPRLVTPLILPVTTL
jgi:hypothetical protein